MKYNYSLVWLALLFILVLPGSPGPVAETADAGNRFSLTFSDALQQAETMPRLYSLLVSWKGDVVLERYYNNSGPDDMVNIKSASKSVISALTGIAISRGYIPGINSSIDSYFPQLVEQEADPLKAAITVEDLLTMQSGLVPTSNRNYGAWVLSQDWLAYILERPLDSIPGGTMRYSTGNTHLLSAIITRAAGMSTLEFARTYLAGPLGFRLAAWPTDPEGVNFGGNDMEMTARQMLAFGQLYLNRGAYQGNQVMSEDWVRKSLQPHARSTRHHQRYYGYGWWLDEMAGHEVAYAWGYGGQYIIIVPELEMVVVTTSSSIPDEHRRSHRRELAEILEQHVIGSIARETSLTQPAGSEQVLPLVLPD